MFTFENVSMSFFNTPKELSGGKKHAHLNISEPNGVDAWTQLYNKKDKQKKLSNILTCNYFLKLTHQSIISVLWIC